MAETTASRTGDDRSLLIDRVGHCVLQRLLAGVPEFDLGSAALTCKAFCAVITDPRFPEIRRRHGFLSGIVVVKSDGSRIEIRLAKENRVLGGFTGYDHPDASTTDGRRLLFSAIPSNGGPRPREDVFVVEPSTSYPHPPIQWRHLVTLPRNQRYLRSIACHNGRLYIFGGCIAVDGNYTDDPGNPGTRFFDSLQVYNEASGLWEDRPSMPRACVEGSSAVIGDCLYLAGGYVGHDGPGHYQLSTLQIYDFNSRTWRFGAPMPEGAGGWGVAFDGKLFCIGLLAISFYDPQANTWTVDETELPWQDMAREASYQHTFGATVHTFYHLHIAQAISHQGRIVVFLDNGAVFARAADGSWSRYEVAEGTAGGRGYMKAASVLLG